jgi:DNA-binding transcriptional LysR family regulator
LRQSQKTIASIVFCAWDEKETAMDVKRLTHFIALAEEGRFSLAAARVHLSQAAFSRSIQHLEEQMGLRLFDRGAKGARPTPAGEVVLERARELVFDSSCLQRDIELVKQGDVGEIAIGAAPIPAAVLVPDMLCELRRQSPQLVTRVYMGNLPKLLMQMDAQEIDFCLGDPRLMGRSTRYDKAHVGKQMGGLYCRPGHPLTRKRHIDAKAIESHGIAVISIPLALRDAMASAYGFPVGADFPVSVECDDIHTLVHLVRHTDVLSLLPHSVARAGPKPLHYLEVASSKTTFADVYAIWLKGRTLSPAARRAIALAREVSVSLNDRTS